MIKSVSKNAQVGLDRRQPLGSRRPGLGHVGEDCEALS
jgi:hypothetical protein